MAYAYHRGSVADNIQFYEYTIHNRSGVTYDSLRFGIWADMDLGYANDDYIGFDSLHRMGVAYNAVDTDGNGQAHAYGASMPLAGISMLRMPGENCLPVQPAGSFSYYNNTSFACGNPILPQDYNGLLRSQFCYPFLPASKYAYPEDPGSTTFSISECQLNNFQGDRRFVISSEDMNFASNATTSIAFALVTTDPALQNSCPFTSFAGIKTIADSAAKIFCSPLPAAVPVLAKNDIVQVYPNPAHDHLQVRTTLLNATIVLKDVAGRTLAHQALSTSTVVDVSGLAPGIYLYQVVKDGYVQQQGKFIKQ